MSGVIVRQVVSVLSVGEFEQSGLIVWQVVSVLSVGEFEQSGYLNEVLPCWLSTTQS